MPLFAILHALARRVVSPLSVAATRCILPWGAMPLLLAPALAAAADASAYPAKTVRFILPFAAGGGTDVVARAIAQKLTEQLGQPFIVDNRAGANGSLGADLVAKAPADGYTILFTTNAPIVTNPHMTKLPYDPVRDFSPVSLLTSAPFALLVHPSVPVKSVSDLVKLARSKAGLLNYASSGSGGGAHLSAELLRTTLKLDITHVPYKGANPALIALLGGQVDFMFSGLVSAAPLAKAGRARMLAVTSAKRNPSFPDVPTMAEFPGLTGFETDVWFGMLAPAKTDARIVAKLRDETARVLASSEFRNRFEAQGAVLVGNAPEEFVRIIASDLAKWAVVIKASGAVLD